MEQKSLLAPIVQTIAAIKDTTITADRKTILQPLANYIAQKASLGLPINLNFICTHNSRRSHLSQIWAQTMAHFFNIPQVHCYSGGTEATAMFPMVAATLTAQGFNIQQLSEGKNPVYGVKYAPTAHPIICFSKTFDNPFNPSKDFGAILTCDAANEACPMVTGSDGRFPITYKDPKAFDGTDQQAAKYAERSLQIAAELYWVFQEMASGSSD